MRTLALPRLRPTLSTLAPLALPLLVAAFLFAIAYDSGTYNLVDRGTLAMGVWWTIAMGVLFGIVKIFELSRPVKIVAGLIAAFALWTLLSMAWAPSAENAFNEFNRVALYLGVFLLVSLAITRSDLGRWVDGLTVAIVAIAFVALVSRLFDGLFPDRGIFDLLPKAAIRLNFPLGYWNALAVFVALSVPLALRAAVGARNPVVRAAALSSLPVTASVVYLASSRGGMLTAILGAVLFFVLSERRWSVAGALAAGCLGGAAAVAVLRARNELVEGPLNTDLVESQGRSAALLILCICVLTAVVYGLGSRYLAGRLSPSRRLGQISLAVVALLLVAGLFAAHPLRRFEQFKQMPTSAETASSVYFSNEHLLSGSGNGRWQIWSGATDQWRDSPIAGDGAGSFATWWAESGSYSATIKDAHSLYIETLGELGLIGFLILASALVFGAAVAVRRCFHAKSDRLTAAALAAGFLAFGVEAGFDWMWEMTAVSIVGWSLLALALGPIGERSMQRKPWPRFVRTGSIAASAVVALLLVGAQAIPVLAQTQIEKSQAAVTRGDAQAAEDAALEARRVQPWASSPALQLALVLEQEGDLKGASAWIEEAIDRDEKNWELWLTSTRISVKRGQVEKAEQSLNRIIELNPRSPRVMQLEALLDQAGEEQE